MPVVLYKCIVRHALALGNAGTGGSYHSSSFVMDTRTQNIFHIKSQEFLGIVWHASALGNGGTARN